MGFIFTTLIVFVGGGWLIGKVLGEVLFPNNSTYTNYTPRKESPTIINNYTTNIQQNLNITEDQLNKLKR